MNELKRLKINIIADIQSKLNKQVKEWCQKDNKVLEKRSFVHGDSEVFMNKEFNLFTINKTIGTFNNLFENYTLEELSLKQFTFAKIMADDFMSNIDNQFRLYVKTINKDKILSTHQCIKFIFYGLHFIDEDTVQLQYGLTNIVEDVKNVTLVD